MLVAVTSDPLRPRAQARAAAEEAAATLSSADGPSLAPDTPVTFANAWAGLISAIGSAQLTEEISDHAAESHRARQRAARGVSRRRRRGDRRQARDLEEEFGKAVEDDEIAGAADTIDQAIFDVGVALGGESALETGSPPPAKEPSSGEGARRGHGPPAHAEANGQDEKGD